VIEEDLKKVMTIQFTADPMGQGGSPMSKISRRHSISLLTLSAVIFAFPAYGQSNPDPAGSEAPLPKQYRILPVPRGPLEANQKHSLVGHTVKDKQGNKLGTLDNVIVDTGTGKIEAGVIRYTTANKTIALIPVSWRDLKIDPKSGDVRVMRTSEELLPTATSRNVKDMSPDVQALVKDMQEEIAQSTPQEMKIEVTMKDKEFTVEGHSLPGSLTAIVLRNQDNVTHGFSSNLFKEVRAHQRRGCRRGHYQEGNAVLPCRAGEDGHVVFQQGP
jgi:sporulation protein YlmC with PRC-barrel domain